MYATLEKTILEALLTQWSGEFFYLPIFRCVKAAENASKGRLIEELLSIRIGSAFYDYESDRRWYDSHQMEVGLQKTIINDKWIAIPVRSKKSVKVYCYGTYDQQVLKNIKSKLETGDECQLFWFSNTNQNSSLTPSHHIYFQEFQRKIKSAQPVEIREFGDLSLDIQSTFAEISGSETEWVKPLYEDLASKKVTSPVYCAIIDKKIVGVIGPLDIMSDIEGEKFLAPTYFAVDENYRRKGIGKTLRSAMEDFACTAGVKYKLLQAEYDSPADKFYAAQGLAIVGKLHKLKA